jgi:hypothetical protein
MNSRGEQYIKFKQEESDEFLGKYCENCHIATGLCDCKDCDICEEARV